tara:strand:- start:944 stop:2002 length:1059 start_codon:yes stop_codon:yes gene_type:complete
MSIVTDDLRIERLDQLIAPVIIIDELHLSDESAEVVMKARKNAERILKGQDDRLLVVVGPCSIHDPEAALEYAEKLKDYAKGAEEDLEIIMRVYFEKPRTTVGWKGFINDPGLDDSFDINRGLHLARKLLVTLADMGIAAGTEFLDTISPQYVADLVAWGAIGARTTESQMHRELASGLSMPVGFKNGTGGNIKIAVDAIKSAQSSHHFLSVKKSGTTAIVTTKGNDSCHVILRGGAKGPNFDEENVAATVALLEKAGMPPHVMIDCSHGNSEKDHNRQPLVAEELAKRISAGDKHLVAVMIESHLKAGNQPLKDPKNLEYGQSITDACVDWDTTVKMLDGLAESVRNRRTK